MHEDDQDALAAARVVAGDSEAFEEIVQRWQQKLVNMAWRFCRDRSMAEDMAQEAFIKAYRSLAQFRGESKFSTWLISIAANTYRSRLRAEGQPLLSLDPARLRMTGEDAAGDLEERQRTESVRRAVATLPPRYREAIVVYYLEEKNLTETAGALGVAEGTLKARLYRGRELLRSRCAKLWRGHDA